MKINFRWCGSGDLVSLEHIHRIPGIDGIVSDAGFASVNMDPA